MADPISVITTARRAFTGSSNLISLTFKNGSAAGILYLLNKGQRPGDTVSSTVNDFSLTAGQSGVFLRKDQGKDIDGPWDAISDTVGGVTLEIITFYERSSL